MKIHADQYSNKTVKRIVLENLGDEKKLLTITFSDDDALAVCGDNMAVIGGHGETLACDKPLSQVKRLNP